MSTWMNKWWEKCDRKLLKDYRWMKKFKIDGGHQNIKNVSFCITILQCFWCCQEDWDVNMREASEETHTGTYIKSQNTKNWK